MDVSPELIQAYREFSTGAKYFNFLEMNDQASPKYLQMETLEGELFKISVTVNGWYCISMRDLGGSDVFYPTFESLASEISHGFRAEWASELGKRLQRFSD